METCTLLDTLLTAGFSCDLFGKVPSDEEARYTRYRYMGFLREYAFKWVSKPFNGYYVVDRAASTVYGLEPVNVGELYLLILYVTTLLITNPKVDVSIDILRILATEYELPGCEEFIEGISVYIV